MNLTLNSPPSASLSHEDLQKLLMQDATSWRIQQKESFPKKEQLVGVRLNLNILKTTGKAVQTLHEASNEIGYKKNQGFYKGQACGYAEIVVLKNAYFNVNQTARDNIATGKNHKYPMASIDGNLQGLAAPEKFEGIEIRFNPRDHHLFVDQNNHAIRCAEEVVIVGHRAYARGKIEYYTNENSPKKKGVAPSKTLFKSPEPSMASQLSLSRRTAFA